MTVHRYLVTAHEGQKLDLWMPTSPFANWIEGRENPRGGETWLVTCFDDNSAQFLDSARRTGVTVEEIDGAGDEERYRLLVGEPGTGWDGTT